MDENGRLMLRETALKNLVLNFFRTHLKISSENLTKIDMDRIFLPDNFRKSSFEKVYVEFPNVAIVGWLLSHVKNLERGEGEGGAELGHYTPPECYGRYSSFEEQAY